MPNRPQPSTNRTYIDILASFFFPRCTRKPTHNTVYVFAFFNGGVEQADELINSSRCPSLELTPRPSATNPASHPGSGGSSDTGDAIARLVQGLQSDAPPATSAFRDEQEGGRLAGGVSTKTLRHSSSGDDEVEVPPGAEKFQGPAPAPAAAPAAPAPSHSRDWEAEAIIPQEANGGRKLRFDAESPEID